MNQDDDDIHFEAQQQWLVSLASSIKTNREEAERIKENMTKFDTLKHYSFEIAQIFVLFAFLFAEYLQWYLLAIIPLEVLFYTFLRPLQNDNLLSIRKKLESLEFMFNKINANTQLHLESKYK